VLRGHGGGTSRELHAAHVEAVTDLRVLHRISPGTVQAVTLGERK
jgi:hypothetical protein